MPRTRTIVIAILTAFLLLSATATYTGALTRGSPDISVFLEDDRVTAGEQTTLGVQLLNGGDQVFGSGSASDEQRVTTARDVRITLRESRAPIEIETDTQPVGNVPEGLTDPTGFTVNVFENATPGTYRVPVQLEYKYTDQISRTSSNSKYHTESTVTETKYVTIQVTRSSRFQATDASLNTLIDDSGTLSLNLENIGEADATQTRVEITSHDSQLTFTGETSIETFLGTAPSGTTLGINIDAELDPDAQQRSYPISIDITYEDEDGETQTADTLTTGVTFEDRQNHFKATTTESSLEVGAEGQLTGTITNIGTDRVTNAVVTLHTSNPNINSIESSYNIGNLAPDQSTTFSFDVDVSESATPGPRLFTVETRYRTPKDIVKTSDPLDLNATVGPKSQIFSIEPVDTTVTAGGTRTVTLRVTNQANEPLTDISAKLFTNAPISSGDDEAFIAQLTPGETQNITFLISAGGGALEKSYPVSIDFQYDDQEGDTLLSDTYRVPITVEAQQRQSGVMTGIAVIVLVALGIGGYSLYRRRA